LEYLGLGLVVDPRLTRFQNVYFWVRGSKAVPAEVATAVKFARKYLAASSESWESEQVPVHRRVVLLLHYRSHQFEARGYRDVARQDLNELVTGGVAKLRAMDVLLMRLRLTMTMTTMIIALIVQKVLRIGVYRHIDIGWQWTLLIFVPIALVSEYFYWVAKLHYYHRRLAEKKLDKSIASDEALLTYLINEAEEETIKETLLTLLGILNRTERQKESLTVFGIEANATEWLRSELEPDSFHFKTSAEALKILEQTGMIVRDGSSFSLSLPVPPSSPPSSGRSCQHRSLL